MKIEMSNPIVKKFEYDRPVLTVEAYGKTYTLPVKTAEVIDKINSASKKSYEAKSAIEQTAAIKEGIAVFIGSEEVERIYPDNAAVDNDEISAFWMLLNSAANEFTAKITEKYKSPSAVKK